MVRPINDGKNATHGRRKGEQRGAGNPEEPSHPLGF